MSPPRSAPTQAAIESLRQGDVEKAREILAAALRAHPDDERARSLLQLLLVMRKDWPIERRATPPIRPYEPARRLHVVVLHIDRPTVPTDIHVDTDYWSALRVCFAAALSRVPGCRTVLLTDMTTLLPAAVGAETVIRSKLDPAALMYERMRAQRDYLETVDGGDGVLFMDSDVVVNRDLSGLFDGSFDLALTWRTEFPHAPFNGGLIMARGGDPARQIFDHALACYRDLAAERDLAELFPCDLTTWWGDQFAWGRLIGYRQLEGAAGDARWIGPTLVRLFPCASYNFTPEPGEVYEESDLAQKFFLHFKGNRKAMAPSYAAP